MTATKIIDTCTLINVVYECGLDLSTIADCYDIFTTSSVIKEYTCKYPRDIPSGIQIIYENSDDLETMSELKNIIPRLGLGERSIIAVALRLRDINPITVVLTDDMEAKKKIVSSRAVNERYPGLLEMKWGDKEDLIQRLTAQ